MLHQPLYMHLVLPRVSLRSSSKSKYFYSVCYPLLFSNITRQLLLLTAGHNKEPDEGTEAESILM